MRRLEHMVLGSAAGALVAHVTGGELGILILAGAIAGPLPDMDRQWAPRWKVPYPGSACGLDEHRGPTHSFAAVAVVFVLAEMFLPGDWPQREVLAWALTAGYASHLLADAISPMGLPFFWPLIWTRIRVLPDGMRIKSGTRLFELPFAVGLLLAVLLVR